MIRGRIARTCQPGGIVFDSLLMGEWYLAKYCRPYAMILAGVIIPVVPLSRFPQGLNAKLEGRLQTIFGLQLVTEFSQVRTSTTELSLK